MRNIRSIFGILPESKYDSIIAYNSLVEDNIKKMQSELYKECEVHKDAQDDYSLYMIDNLSEKIRLNEDILQNHRKSIIFMFYSLLEQEFHLIAEIIGSESVFKITDLKGSSEIEKLKLYIKKIEPKLLEEITNEDEEKNDLYYFDKVRLLRNFITHHNSIINKANNNYKKIEEFSSNRFTLSPLPVWKKEDDYFKIELDRADFIAELFDRFKLFIAKIYK